MLNYLLERRRLYSIVEVYIYTWHAMESQEERILVDASLRCYLLKYSLDSVVKTTIPQAAATISLIRELLIVVFSIAADSQSCKI